MWTAVSATVTVSSVQDMGMVRFLCGEKSFEWLDISLS